MSGFSKTFDRLQYQFKTSYEVQCFFFQTHEWKDYFQRSALKIALLIPDLPKTCFGISDINTCFPIGKSSCSTVY